MANNPNNQMVMSGGAAMMHRQGGVPNLSDLQAARTTIPGAKEVIAWTYYDRQVYPAAGITKMRFFQQIVGQQDSAGHLRTSDDTNLEQAGTLPAGYHFLLKSISLRFYPGVLPGRSGTASPLFLNDVYTFNSHGSARFYVQTKDFVRIAPLEALPPPTRLEVNAALSDTTTAAANRLTSVDYASACGRPLMLADLSILNGYTFGVELSWENGLVPLPSGQAGNVYANLHGFLYRVA